MTRSTARSRRPNPWWPGSSYVTWVGIDGYYLKPSWKFAPLFGPTIGVVQELTADPILIAETGAVPASGQPAKISRPVRRHPPLRAARVRMVRRHKLHRPRLRHQQPRGRRRVPPGREHVPPARVMSGPPRLTERQASLVGGATVSADTERTGRHRQAPSQTLRTSAATPGEAGCSDRCRSRGGGHRREPGGAGRVAPGRVRARAGIPRSPYQRPAPTSGFTRTGSPARMRG